MLSLLRALFVTLSFLSVYASDIIQSNVKKEFPYIQPVAVEEILKLQKIQQKNNKADENITNNNINKMLINK